MEASETQTTWEGPWQNSIAVVDSLQLSHVKLDIVASNAMLAAAATPQRLGWIHALAILAEMACYAVALSEAPPAGCFSSTPLMHG